MYPLNKLKEKLTRAPLTSAEEADLEKECRGALKSHMATTIALAIVFSLLVLAALLVGTRDTIKYGAFLAIASLGLLAQRIVKRMEFMSILASKYPKVHEDISGKAAASLGLPPYQS